MNSTNKSLNFVKIMVLVLVLGFCLIPFIKNIKFDNIDDDEIVDVNDTNIDVGKNDDVYVEGEIDDVVDNNDNTTSDNTVINDNTNNNVDSNKDNANNSIGNNKDNVVNNNIVGNNNGNNKKIVVEDRTNGSYCAQAIEYFYEDSQYRYYFTCIKSNSMYVIVNGNEYKLVYALENRIVTMKELENNGYKFLKKSKNAQIR